MPAMENNNSSLIVTGSESGIGAECTKVLEPHINGLMHRVDVKGSPPLDVRSIETGNLIEQWVVPGGKNYLLHSAGAVFFTDHAGNGVDFANSPWENLESMIDINIKGTILVVQAFIRGCIAKNAQGNIVIISSISAFHNGGPNMAVYDATKAAVSALPSRLAAYYKNGIIVNAIQPGSIRTGIGGYHPDFSPNEEGLAAVKKGQDDDSKRLGTEVTPKQVAQVAEMLMFNNLGFNGACLTVDAGLTQLGRDGY